MSTAPQAVYVPYKTLRQERCFITATEVANTPVSRSKTY